MDRGASQATIHGVAKSQTWLNDLTSCVCVCVCVKVTVARSCPTVCDPRDYTVHGILQAVSFSEGSSQPRDGTQVWCITGEFFTSWATREAQEYWVGTYPFSRGSSWPRDQTGVSCIADGFFTSWATWAAIYVWVCVCVGVCIHIYRYIIRF